MSTMPIKLMKIKYIDFTLTFLHQLLFDDNIYDNGTIFDNESKKTGIYCVKVRDVSSFGRPDGMTFVVSA